MSKSKRRSSYDAAGKLHRKGDSFAMTSAIETIGRDPSLGLKRVSKERLLVCGFYYYPDTDTLTYAPGSVLKLEAIVNPPLSHPFGKVSDAHRKGDSLAMTVAIERVRAWVGKVTRVSDDKFVAEGLNFYPELGIVTSKGEQLISMGRGCNPFAIAALPSQLHLQEQDDTPN